MTSFWTRYHVMNLSFRFYWVNKWLRSRLQILLLMSSEFKQINLRSKLLFLLKPTTLDLFHLSRFIFLMLRRNTPFLQKTVNLLPRPLFSKPKSTLWRPYLLLIFLEAVQSDKEKNLEPSFLVALGLKTLKPNVLLYGNIFHHSTANTA